MILHLPRVTLTDREIQVLAFASQGMSAKEIARALMIASRTVDKHFENLRTKTGARNRPEQRGGAIASRLRKWPRVRWDDVCWGASDDFER